MIEYESGLITEPNISDSAYLASHSSREAPARGLHLFGYRREQLSKDLSVGALWAGIDAFRSVGFATTRCVLMSTPYEEYGFFPLRRLVMPVLSASAAEFVWEWLCGTVPQVDYHLVKSAPAVTEPPEAAVYTRSPVLSNAAGDIDPVPGYHLAAYCDTACPLIICPEWVLPTA